MNQPPARLLQGRHADDARLRRALADLRDELPSGAELSSVLHALRAGLDAEDGDSGVRRLPRPQPLRLVVPARDRSEPEDASDRDPWQLADRALAGQRRWRAMALGAVAAALTAGVLLLVSNARGPGAVASDPLLVVAPDGAVAAPSPSRVPDAGRAEPEAVPEPRKSPPPPKPPGPAPAPDRHARTEGARLAQAAEDKEVEQAHAMLNLNSIPVSAVLLDGRPLGGTPRLNVTVTPGEHRVVFIHPERGRRYRTVNADRGRTVVAAVRFQ